MRALKVLVIVMGVALVAGTVALVMAVVARVEHRGPISATAAGHAAPLHTALPAGSRVLSMELAGDRLAVRIARADGGEAIMLFDARTGAEVAVIDGPAP